MEHAAFPIVRGCDRAPAVHGALIGPRPHRVLPAFSWGRVSEQAGSRQHRGWVDRQVAEANSRCPAVSTAASRR